MESLDLVRNVLLTLSTSLLRNEMMVAAALSFTDGFKIHEVIMSLHFVQAACIESFLSGF